MTTPSPEGLGAEGLAVNDATDDGEDSDPTPDVADAGTPPEGPARVTSSRRPANWGSQPLGLWWVFPAGLTIAIWVLFGVGVKAAGYVVAATLVVVAVLRLVLPRSAVGGLLVRSRAWDVLILVGFAVAVVGVTATLVIR